MAADEDTHLEAAVLRLLLTEHPSLHTHEELERELTQGRMDPVAEDAIARAVAALAGAGLVNRQGELVLPSRAALYFDRLPVD